MAPRIAKEVMAMDNQPLAAPSSSLARDWRERLLRQAGCEPRLAAALAGDARYDLSEILDLIGRGCPPPVAARILAPDGIRGHPG